MKMCNNISYIKMSSTHLYTDTFSTYEMFNIQLCINICLKVLVFDNLNNG
jgi:hypothetical protein